MLKQILITFVNLPTSLRIKLYMFGFINTLNNKKQNIEFGMKKIIAWWTGATSDWSGAIITNWMISICEHNDSCSQVRILPVHMF